MCIANNFNMMFHMFILKKLVKETRLKYTDPQFIVHLAICVLISRISKTPPDKKIMYISFLSLGRNFFRSKIWDQKAANHTFKV